MKHEWEVMTTGESTSRSSVWFKWRCARCEKVVESKPPETGRDSIPPTDDSLCAGTIRAPKFSLKKEKGEG